MRRPHVDRASAAMRRPRVSRNAADYVLTFRLRSHILGLYTAAYLTSYIPQLVEYGRTSITALELKQNLNFFKMNRYFKLC